MSKKRKPHQKSARRRISRHASIGPALDRAGKELQAIAKQIADLEDTIGHTLDISVQPQDLRLEELQKLDLVRQQIDGVATFLAALAKDSRKSWKVDSNAACLSLQLSELAARLGANREVETRAPGAGSGDYELFN